MSEIPHWTYIAGLILRSFTIAGIAAIVNLLPGILCAYLTLHCEFRGKRLFESLLMAPLIMPPVATGLLLLTLLSHEHSVGRMMEHLVGRSLLLTPAAAVLAAAFVSFPLLYQQVKLAMAHIDPQLYAIAKVYGLTRWQQWRCISLPLAWRGLAQGLLLAFARGLGEFGATILVAGNIPGKTETLSLAIYDRVMSGHSSTAWILVGINVLTIFVILIIKATFLQPRWLPAEKSYA